MNQYLFLRRMRGPIILLVFGITAILDEYAGISYGHSWPLYLIVWGLLKLAENAVLAQHPPTAQGPWPGYQPPPGNQPWASSPPPTTTAIVPTQEEERR